MVTTVVIVSSLLPAQIHVNEKTSYKMHGSQGSLIERKWYLIMLTVSRDSYFR